MTKFKKCDYCGTANNTVEKYKTGLVETFGQGMKGGGNIRSETRDRMVFFLCGVCEGYLIEDRSAIRNRTVDERYWNEHLNQYIFKASNSHGDKISGRRGY